MSHVTCVALLKGMVYGIWPSLHFGVDLVLAPEGGVLVDVPLPEVGVVALLQPLVLRVVAVCLVVAPQPGVQADGHAAPGAAEVAGVGAGQAPGPRLRARPVAVVRIPVLRGVGFVLQEPPAQLLVTGPRAQPGVVVVRHVFVTNYFLEYFDVNIDIAGLADGKELIRIVFTGEVVDCFVCLVRGYLSQMTMNGIDI